MPMSGNNYVAPTWVNYGPPALDADELNAISGTLENLELSQGDIAAPYSKMGLTGTPTIGASLGVLADIGNVYVWRKTVTTDEGIPEVPEVPPSYELGEAQTQYFIRDKDRGKAITMLYSNSVSVSYDGRVSLVSPSSVVITTTNTTYPFTYVSGKFIQAQGGGTGVEPETTSIFYMKPSGVLQNSGESSSWDVYGTECQMVNGIAAVPGTPAVPPGTHITYLTSVNRNAYQEGDDAKEAGSVLGEVVAGKTPISMAYDGRGVVIGSTNQVEENGAISFAPDSGATQYWSNSVDVSLMKGKFLHTVGGEGDSDEIGNFSDPNYWVYIPEDAVITRESPVGSSTTIFTTKYQPVTGYPAIPAGITIEYLGVLGEGVKVQTGSYIGTGTYGPSNPSSLTFEFSPKILLLSGGGSRPDLFIADFFGRTNIVLTGQLNLEQKSITAKGKTISWWNNESYTGTSADAVQMNSNGILYEYIAFG